MKRTIILIESDGYLHPDSERDFPMFGHCTGGSISITPEYYNSVSKDVFDAHNIITYIKKNTKKTVPVIHLTYIVEAIDEACENFYSGLPFGKVTSTQLMEKIDILSNGEDYLLCSVVGALLTECETSKLAGGSNRGINHIRMCMKRKKIHIKKY